MELAFFGVWLHAARLFVLSKMRVLSYKIRLTTGEKFKRSIAVKGVLMKKALSIFLCVMMLVGMVPIGAVAAEGTIEPIELSYDYVLKEDEHDPTNTIITEYIKIKNPEDGFLYATKDSNTFDEMYFKSDIVGQSVGTISAPCAFESGNFWVTFSDDVRWSSWQSSPVLEVVKIKKDNWNFVEEQDPWENEEIWDDKDCVVYGYSVFVRPAVCLTINATHFEIGDEVTFNSVAAKPVGHKGLSASYAGWYDDKDCLAAHVGGYANGSYYLKVKIESNINTAIDPLDKCLSLHVLNNGTEKLHAVNKIVDESGSYLVFEAVKGTYYNLDVSVADKVDGVEYIVNVIEGASGGKALGGSVLKIEAFELYPTFISNVKINGVQAEFSCVGNNACTVKMPECDAKIEVYLTSQDKVIIDPNGGEFGYEGYNNCTFIDERVYTVSLNCPTMIRDGHTLISLNTKSDGTGDEYLPDEYFVFRYSQTVNNQHDEITLYAIWEKEGGEETLIGDVNGDGSVNNKDVVALFRYVSGDENTVVVEDNCDVNNDGSVNNKDVVALFKLVSEG